MNANRWALMLGVLAVLTLAAGTAWTMPMFGPVTPVPMPSSGGGFRPSAPPPTGGRTAPPPDGGRMPTPGPTPAAGPVSLTGEYADMVREANLSVIQQKSVGTMQQDEEKALAQYDKENTKRLEDLRKRLAEAKNDVARNANQKQIDQVAAIRDLRSRSYKLRAVGIMTPPQKAAWATYLLNKMMTDEFGALGLTAEQQGKVRTLCELKAKEVTNADVAGNKELQAGLKQQIITQVLDEEQRTRYTQMLQEREAAKNPPPAGGAAPAGGGAPPPPPSRTAPPPDRPTAPPPT